MENKTKKKNLDDPSRRPISKAHEDLKKSVEKLRGGFLREISYDYSLKQSGHHKQAHQVPSPVIKKTSH